MITDKEACRTINKLIGVDKNDTFEQKTKKKIWYSSVYPLSFLLDLAAFAVQVI